MATLISVLTNQFFLIFLAIALGLLLGKVKIGNFSLGVSGGIFSGIVLGYIAQAWAKGVQEGELGYASAAVGILIGNITIPLGSFGEFSLGAAGGILVSALIFSYIGKIGPINFRMDQKALGILYQTGLTFFMAVVGLRYGYDVVNSLLGSGPQLTITAVLVEAIAVLIAFIVGHKVFKINWIILSGAIAGGCTSAPGLGAAISATGSEEPTAGYGAAQPFAILANVLLATLFFNIV